MFNGFDRKLSTRLVFINVYTKIEISVYTQVDARNTSKLDTRTNNILHESTISWNLFSEPEKSSYNNNMPFVFRLFKTSLGIKYRRNNVLIIIMFMAAEILSTTSPFTQQWETKTVTCIMRGIKLQKKIIIIFISQVTDISVHARARHVDMVGKFYDGQGRKEQKFSFSLFFFFNGYKIDDVAGAR